ncbi:hypothetical protein EJP82_17520 [Paenibacillus anaericanus]|uniref:Uncharacterized protein n=1 Tax=Paenibacillus anaericanus TaxID=170367 RepID=A0A433Y654_9BACL|nr:hypothetical protein [Paenibacillus anaericanus]RUT44418.1 hypothetical protein EJP82_17520 [Paenibacillus anaericanus]
MNENILLSAVKSKITYLSDTIISNSSEGWEKEFEVTIAIDDTLNALGSFIIVGDDTEWLSENEQHELWGFYRVIDSSPPKSGTKYRVLSDAERIQLIELAEMLKQEDWKTIQSLDQFIQAISRLI